MDKKFEFLEHTADTKIRAYGINLEDAFKNVVIATTSVMTNPDLLKESSSKKVFVKSKNLKALLYDFLEELLFLFDTEGFLAKKAITLKIVEEDGFDLSCDLIGDFVSGGYDVHTTAKAATYSEMDITHNNEGVVLQFVLDL